jgi:tetratricopeptide (TPR) repeat protein
MDDLNAIGMLVGAVGWGAVTLAYFVRRKMRVRGSGTGDLSTLSAARLAEAEAHLRMGLAHAQGRFGEDSWRTAFHLGALSEVLVNQGKLDEARPLMHRALAMHDAMRVQPVPQWPVLLVQAAQLEAAQGHLDRAWRHLERARHEAGGPTRTSVLRSSARLLFKHEQRVQALEAAMQIPYRRLVPGDVRLLGNLAMGMARDDLERAVVCMARVVSFLDRPFRRRPEHAFYLARLGELLVRAGRDAEARARLQQAIAAYERHVGPDHPVLAPLLVTLAETQARLGDLPAARATCRRAAALSCMAERTGERPYRTSNDARDPLADERRRVQQLLLTSAAGSPGAPAS